MPLNWPELIQRSEILSNVKIVCEDGIVTSHKIIVASVSNFIKNIISDIPVGDDITIHLLDFKSESIENYLYHIIMDENFIDKELDKVFNRKYPVKIEQNEQDYPHSDSKDFKYFPSELETSDAGDLNSTEAAISESEEEEEEVESDFNPSAKTKENKKKQRLKKEIQFNKAVADFKSGKFTSVYAAAKKHKVDNKTLKKLLLNPDQKYTGPGKLLTVLTVDEEKSIVHRIIERTKAGEIFNFKKVCGLLLEEFNTIKINQLDRDISKGFAKNAGGGPYGSDVNSKFFWNFCTRHSLRQYFKPEHLAQEYPQLDFKDFKPLSLELMEPKKVIQIKKNCMGKKEKLKTPKVKDDEQMAILKSAEKKAAEMECSFIKNPKTKEERIKNRKLKTEINFNNAVADFNSGICKTINEAAKKHKVNNKTLKNLVLNPEQKYIGSGKVPMLLTLDEEKIIVDRAIARTGGEEFLDHKKICDLLLEELSIIQINQPDRDISKAFAKKDGGAFGSGLKQSIIYNFCARHDLKKFFKPDDKQRDFECEICYKKFTLKNALVAHQRTVHRSFYVTNS